MRLESMRHLDEVEIEKYSMGNSSEEESSRCEEHLLVCEACQERVAASDTYVTAMQGASRHIRRGGGEPEATHRLISRPIIALAVAASAMLLAAVGWERVNTAAKAERAGDEPAFGISLSATRGNGIEAKVPAGRALVVRLNLEGLQPETLYNLQLVDRLGKGVWKGSAAAQDSKASVIIPRMAAGLYFLRTYSPEGKLLREYGLEVTAP